MVEFKTKFNAELEGIMKNESQRKVKKLYGWLSGILIGLGLLMLLIAFFDYQEGLVQDAVDDIYYGVFLLVFGCVFYPIMRLVLNKTQKKEVQSMSLLSDETEEVFKFDDDKIFIFTNKGEDFRSAVETNYKYINNVVETEDYYVLYISKIQCHILQKKDIVSGSIEELNKIFEKHFAGDRFKKLLKKN